MRTFTEELLCIQLNKSEVQILNDLLKHISASNDLNGEEDILLGEIMDDFDGFLEDY